MATRCVNIRGRDPNLSRRFERWNCIKLDKRFTNQQVYETEKRENAEWQCIGVNVEPMFWSGVMQLEARPPAGVQHHD
jgi:hypothetical protein